MRILDVLKASSLLAVTLVALGGVVLEVQTSRALTHLDRDEGFLSQGMADTFDKINRPCKGAGDDKADHCGTLSLAGQTMANVGDLIKESQLAERKQLAFYDQQLPPMLAQGRQALENAQVVALDAHGLMVEAQQRTAALEPAETNAARLIADLDRQATNPAIAHAVSQLDAATVKANAIADKADLAAAHADAVAAHADAVSANAELESNRLTHPFSALGRWFKRLF